MKILSRRTLYTTLWFPMLTVSTSEDGQLGHTNSGPAAAMPHGGSILVVDDDPSILEMVADLLEYEGYQVATATNGAEGLRAVKQFDPSLVLLDMRMPVLDGWGFARALKAEGVSPPILVMTAAQNAHHWAQEIDAAGYLAKPFNVADLLEMVEEMLG